MAKGQIAPVRRAPRTDHILLRIQWPGLEHHEALGSIERVGRIIATVG